MNRNDFQRLAKARAKDAKALLYAKRYQAAYYLAGLAVECALKSCIASKTRRFEFHDLAKARASHVHDLAQLAKQVPSLWIAHAAEVSANPKFASNWSTVDKWDVVSRYDWRISDGDAKDMVKAVTDSPDGILEWLTKHWNA